jgi:hypothetical protein
MGAAALVAVPTQAPEERRTGPPDVEETAHARAMMIMAGCSQQTVVECRLPWQAPGGTRARESYLGASDIVTGSLPAAGIATAR